MYKFSYSEWAKVFLKSKGNRHIGYIVLNIVLTFGFTIYYIYDEESTNFVKIFIYY
jgi:hypothetical protein